VADIAQALGQGFGAARGQKLEQQRLSLRGLTLQTFYANHTSLNQNIVALLDNQMSQYNLGLELLLAGVDPSGAHIYSVMHPGPPENLHDTIGYAAVGSGTIHALQSLIGFGHSADAEYHQTVFRVYAAKRRSEVAPGVGLDTDMAVISGSGIHWLTVDELQQLSEIYDEYEKATSTELQKQLKNFRLGEAQQGGEDGDRTAASPKS
jgi:hypothetical protein